MYLHLIKSGKYWRLNYRFVGKQKTLALGTYPFVSLAEARTKRDDAKKQIAGGIDPSVEKKIAKITLYEKHEDTFEVLAREWHANKLHTWSDTHGANILKRLETNIFPKVRNRPIRDLTPPELLDAIKGIEQAGMPPCYQSKSTNAGASIGRGSRTGLLRATNRV